MLSLVFLAFIMLIIGGFSYAAGHAFKDLDAGPGITIFIIVIIFIVIFSTIFALTERIKCEVLYEFQGKDIMKVERADLLSRHFCYIQIDKKP